MGHHKQIAAPIFSLAPPIMTPTATTTTTTTTTTTEDKRKVSRLSSRYDRQGASQKQVTDLVERHFCFSWKGLQLPLVSIDAPGGLNWPAQEG